MDKNVTKCVDCWNSSQNGENIFTEILRESDVKYMLYPLGRVGETNISSINRKCKIDSQDIGTSIKKLISEFEYIYRIEYKPSQVIKELDENTYQPTGEIKLVDHYVEITGVLK